MIQRALLLMALVAGCAPGKSIVTVVLDGDAAAPVGPIATLSVTPADGGGHKDTITIPVGATIPPAYTFSLRFDASVKTTITSPSSRSTAMGSRSAAPPATSTSSRRRRRGCR